MSLSRRLSTCCAAAIAAVALSSGVPAHAAPAAPAAVENPLLRGAAAPGDLLGAYQSAVEVLRGLGIDPFFYPTAAAFCGDGPLGLLPAAAGAVPGPWPKTGLNLPGLDLSAVKSGQTLFAFVPYGMGPDSGATAGLQVAWLNVSTGRAGMAAMGPLADVIGAMIPSEVPAQWRPIAEQALRNLFAAALPVGGIRAVPVDTGKGTVLAAVFGSVRNGDRDCFFLPTVGLTTVG